MSSYHILKFVRKDELCYPSNLVSICRIEARDVVSDIYATTEFDSYALAQRGNSNLEVGRGR